MKYLKPLMFFLFLLLSFTYFSINIFPDFIIFKIWKELPPFLNLVVSLIFIVFAFFVVFFPMYKYAKNQNDKFWAILTILVLLMVLILGVYQVYLEFFR